MWIITAFRGRSGFSAPQGSAALFVRQDILEQYKPAINDTEKPYPYQDEKIAIDIRRFEPALPNSFVLPGLGASVDWFLEEVGKRGLLGHSRYRFLCPQSTGFHRRHKPYQPG
jgi:selenocysteine lyase/cysteine desulfurase